MNSLASQYPAFKVPRALGIALGAKKYTRHLPCVCQRMKLTFSCTALYPPRIDAAFPSLNWKFIYNGIQVHPKQASARIIRKSRWNESAWENAVLPTRPIDHVKQPSFLYEETAQARKMRRRNATALAPLHGSEGRSNASMAPELCNGCMSASAAGVPPPASSVTASGRTSSSPPVFPHAQAGKDRGCRISARAQRLRS